MENNLDEVKSVSMELSTSMIETSTEIDVNSKEDLEKATALYHHAKDQIKVIEKAFADHKANAWKAHKDLCSAESEQILPFRKVLALLKPKMTKYLSHLENLKREAQRKEEEELKKSIEKDPTNVAVAPPVQEEKVQGAGTRKTWTYEVEDFEALPDDYKLEDSKALNAIAKAMKTKAKVPGVKFYQKLELDGRK